MLLFRPFPQLPRAQQRDSKPPRKTKRIPMWYRQSHYRLLLLLVLPALRLRNSINVKELFCARVAYWSIIWISKKKVHKRRKSFEGGLCIPFQSKLSLGLQLHLSARRSFSVVGQWVKGLCQYLHIVTSHQYCLSSNVLQCEIRMTYAISWKKWILSFGNMRAAAIECTGASPHLS